MEIFLITLAVLLIAVAIMSVGVIFGNRCISGSCGGLANLRGEDGRSICEACAAPREECRERLLSPPGDDENEEDDSPAAASPATTAER